MYADAETIAHAAAVIDGPVVVVAHSHGGIPTTQALPYLNNVRHISISPHCSSRPVSR
jgi:predicted alpha/beta hydrolase family esterase